MPTSLASVDPPRRAALEAGVPSRHLMEILALDFTTLARNTLGLTLDMPAIGITSRMRLAGQQLLTRKGVDWLQTNAATQASDTVRGWAAFAMIEAQADQPFAQALSAIKPFAEDCHFAVREWAWLALRPRVIAETATALTELTEWVLMDSPYRRRFAVEVTRPRGVWCAHLPLLKATPERALPLLQQLINEPERYVQDSVANWLNDAGKQQPVWVMALTEQWLAASQTPATRRIVQRARRSLAT